MKWKVHIAIKKATGEFTFVTRVNNAQRTIYWERGKVACDLGIRLATEICERLQGRGQQLVIIKCPSSMNYYNR